MAQCVRAVAPQADCWVSEFYLLILTSPDKADADTCIIECMSLPTDRENSSTLRKPRRQRNMSSTKQFKFIAIMVKSSQF